MAPARRWLVDTIVMSAIVGALELLVMMSLDGVDIGIPDRTKALIDAVAMAVTVGPLFAWLQYRQRIAARLEAREGVSDNVKDRRIPGSPHRRVRIAVLGSLAVIIAMIATALWGRLSNIDSAYHFGETLNLAGRQRMLSDRIAHTLANAKDDNSSAIQVDALTRQVTDEASRLTQLMADLRSSRLEVARNAFHASESADSVRHAMIRAIQLSRTSDSDVVRRQSARTTAIEAAGSLRAQSELVTANLEEFGRERSRWSRRVAWTVSSLLSLIILLIAVFVIEPVIQLLRRQHDSITTQTRRLDLIVKSADLGTWEWDLRTGDVVFNNQWAHMLGLSLDEVAPSIETWRSLTHPDDVREVKAIMREHLKGHTPEYKCEQRLRRHDGSWCWVLAAGRVIARDSKGRALRAVGVHMDVSREREAKQDMAAAQLDAERALREVIALRAALDEHSIISVADRSGRMIDVNTGFCRASGYSREELIGQDHRMLNSELHSSAFWAELWSTVTLGRPWRGEICNRRKDGTLYWVDSTIIPYVGADGIIEKYVSIRFDVTSQKRADEALQRTTDLLEEAQSVARLGSWSLDLRTDEVSWSREIYRLYGRRELDGPPTLREMQMYHTPEDAERLTKVAQRTSEDGLPYTITLRTLSGANGVRHVRAQGRARRNGGGRIVGLFGTVMDVTAEVEREAALQLAQTRAEAASQSKSEFLANMSHEIRTPLTAILGYTDLLRAEQAEGIRGSDRLQSIDTIRRAGDHLLSVINDILDISKIEAGRMQLERVETTLPRVLLDVDSLMRTRAAEKGVALSTVLDSPIPDRVLTDPTRLRQILLNLVGNATKFTDVGRVEVRVSVVPHETQPQLRILIDDTGVGMNNAQAALLFEPFAQADSSVTRRFGGTGLGLTICRRLANLMHGDVKLLRTELNVGSCFELTLPLVAAADAQLVHDLDVCTGQHAESANGQAPLRLSGRVLLAEDGEDNQRLIAHHLRSAGASVRVVDNGALALDAIRAAEAAEQPFALLVSDMQMPEMDGYTLARALRAEGSTLPIIALTAHAMADDRQRCLDAGCDDYASKPIDRTTLIATCARWMRPVDESALLYSELANDPDLGELVESFVSALPRRLESLKTGLLEDDLDAVARSAHQLKGAAGGYGFPSISDAAREVEHVVRNKSDRTVIQDAVEMLSVRCQAAVRACATPAHATVGIAESES